MYRARPLVGQKNEEDSMGHSMMTIKVRGDSQVHANAQAHELFQKFFIRYDWNYFNIEAIPKGKISDYGVNTFAELEKLDGEINRNEVIEHEFKGLEAEIKAAQSHWKMPESRQELLDLTMKLMRTLFFNGYNQLASHLRVLAELDLIIDAPTDASLTCRSSSNHFADLTKASEGKKIYYFFVDRHV
jgi:hypothetical protein